MDLAALHLRHGMLPWTTWSHIPLTGHLCGSSDHYHLWMPLWTEWPYILGAGFHPGYIRYSPHLSKCHRLHGSVPRRPSCFPRIGTPTSCRTTTASGWLYRPDLGCRLHQAASSNPTWLHISITYRLGCTLACWQPSWELAALRHSLHIRAATERTLGCIIFPGGPYHRTGQTGDSRYMLMHLREPPSRWGSLAV